MLLEGKRFLLYTVFFLAWISNYAQTVTPQSINCNGSKMTQSNGSLSFTVGELVILTQIDNQGNTLSGGFTAGATLTTVSTKEPDISISDIKVYPNPTTDLLNIKVNHTKEKQLKVSLLDSYGKEIFNERYSGISNTIGINTKAISRGIYFLTIMNSDNKIICSYKVIKN